MTPAKNLPLLMNLAYVAYNRGLEDGEDSFKPIVSNGGLTTFCNRAMQYILNSFGYVEMNGMMANQMHDYMSDPAHGWIEVSEEVGQIHANSGVVVIASRKDIPHGHICLVLPGILEQSYSYGRRIPKVLNIGKDVFIGKKLSFAFRCTQQPKLFALAGMI